MVTNGYNIVLYLYGIFKNLLEKSKCLNEVDDCQELILQSCGCKLQTAINILLDRY